MVFAKKGTIARREKLIARNIQRGAESRARAAAEKEEAQREQQQQAPGAAAAAAAAASPGRRPACSGRRIVTLQHLADSLWCDFCNDALSLRFVESEDRHGLASVFHVRCHRCMTVFKIHSEDKGLLQEDGKQPLYPINLQTAKGCMDAGVSHGQLNKIFSPMDVPSLHRNTFVRAQERVSSSGAAEAKTEFLT